MNNNLSPNDKALLQQLKNVKLQIKTLSNKWTALENNVANKTLSSKQKGKQLFAKGKLLNNASQKLIAKTQECEAAIKKLTNNKTQLEAQKKQLENAKRQLNNALKVQKEKMTVNKKAIRNQKDVAKNLINKIMKNNGPPPPPSPNSGNSGSVSSNLFFNNPNREMRTNNFN